MVETQTSDMIEHAEAPGGLSARFAPIAAALCLLVLLCIQCACTAAFNHSRIGYSRLSDVRLFSTESALKYRYAKWIALGGRVPEVDVDQEYPNGIRPYEEVPLLMEILAGRAYRLVDFGLPFHEFLLRFVALCAGLNVIPLYLWSRRFCRSRAAALLGVLVYLSCVDFLHSRFVFSYLKEDFSFFYITMGAYLFVRAAESRDAADQYWRAVPAAVFWAVALGNWHLSQFYLLIFLAALAGHAALQFARDDADAADGLRRALYVLMPGLAVASIGFPSLRKSGFAFGPAVALGLGLAGALLAFRLKGRSVLVAVVLVAVVLAVLGLGHLLTGSRHARTYAHVYSAMRFKVAELVSRSRPLDPGPYSWEGIAMTAGPFRRPSLKEAATNLGAAFWLAPVGFAMMAAGAWRRRQAALAHTVTLLMSLALSGLYVMMIRTGRSLCFFAALLASSALVAEPGRRSEARRKRLLAAQAALLVGALVWNLHILQAELPRFGERSVERTSAWMPVVKWVRGNTAPDACFAGPFSAMPGLLLDTARPVAFHSDFEIPRNRQTVERFEHAVYGREEALWDWCKDRGVKYLLYSPSYVMAVDKGPRYRTKNLTLPADSAAVELAFHPERLERFVLCFSNEAFRIYRVLPVGQTASNQAQVRMPWDYSALKRLGADLRISPAAPEPG